MKRTLFYRRFDDEWAEDQGYSVSMYGLTMFISGESGFWDATEAKTGLGLHVREGRFLNQPCKTIKSTIKSARQLLKAIGKKRTKEAVEAGIQENGVSPLYN